MLGEAADTLALEAANAVAGMASAIDASNNMARSGRRPLPIAVS